MTRNIILAALLCSIPAMAAAQDSAGTYFNPNNPTLTPQQRDGLAISQEWLDRSATGMRPVAGAEGAVVFLFGATEPSIVCAVLHVCDVQLQPGEQVNSINVGDSARWLIEPAVSGAGAGESQHLIIKPMDVGLSTSLVVTTDRRTYHIRLISHRTEFMPRVAFQYPDDVAAKWAALKAHNEVVRNERTVAVPGGPAAGGAGDRPAAEYLSNLAIPFAVEPGGSRFASSTMASKRSSKCRVRWSRRKRRRSSSSARAAARRTPRIRRSSITASKGTATLSIRCSIRRCWSRALASGRIASRSRGSNNDARGSCCGTRARARRLRLDLGPSRELCRDRAGFRHASHGDGLAG